MTDPYISLAIAHLSTVLECLPTDLSASDDISSVKKWDSLNHMRLVLHLEEDLGQQIETDDAMELFSIQGIAAFLKKKSETNLPGKSQFTASDTL